MYRVYLNNFHYYLEQAYPTLAQAVNAGMNKCFDFSVSDFEGNIYCSWSIIGGLKKYIEEQVA